MASSPRPRWLLPAAGLAATVAVLAVGGLIWNGTHPDGPASDSTRTVPPLTGLIPSNTRLDTVCLMTQGGRQAEVYDASGQRLGTLGTGCVPFSGQFGQTYTLTFRYDGRALTQPITITHRRAWTVQLP